MSCFSYGALLFCGEQLSISRQGTLLDLFWAGFVASIALDLVIQPGREDDQLEGRRRYRHHRLQPRHQGCGVLH